MRGTTILCPKGEAKQYTKGPNATWGLHNPRARYQNSTAAVKHVLKTWRSRALQSTVWCAINCRSCSRMAPSQHRSADLIRCFLRPALERKAVQNPSRCILSHWQIPACNEIGRLTKPAPNGGGRTGLTRGSHAEIKFCAQSKDAHHPRERSESGCLTFRNQPE